jgi:hypothetical protein
MSTARVLSVGIGLCVVVACTTSAPRTVASAQAPRQSPAAAAARFFGTWALVKYESNAADNRAGRGDNPIGLIYYDRTGHMAVQIAPDRRRRPFSGPASGLFSGPRPTPEEALDAISGYAAYFGTYTVDDRAQTVTHKRIANINPGGLGDFVRRYEFQTDDRLVLTPLELTDLRAVRLTWERQKTE